MINFLIKLSLWELHAREFQGFLNKNGLIEISQIEFSGSCILQNVWLFFFFECCADLIIWFITIEQNQTRKFHYVKYLSEMRMFVWSSVTFNF